MEAVIDPASPSIVGYVPPGACRHGGAWADFITLPAPEDMDQETLGVESDGQGGFTFVTDPAKVTQKTQAQWASVRAQQKQKLYESDWTCSVTDYGVPDRELWVQYRAALRDVTKQSDPFNIVWPVMPQ